MKPSDNAYGRLNINSGRLIHEMRGSLESIVLESMKQIRNAKIPDRDFSSIQIHISKRELPKADEDVLEASLRKGEIQMGVMTDEELSQIHPKFPPITVGEWLDLWDEPIAANMIRLIVSRDRSQYTMDEIDSIKAAFRFKYEGQKPFEALWSKA